MISKKPDWLAAKIGDEVVMMSMAKGTYVGLSSDVAARIWELIDTPTDMDSICARLVEEFEVTPETCRAEVEAFIADLVKRGVVETDAAA